MDAVKTRATQRSLAYLRKDGWQVAIVERWLKHPNMPFGKRIDVWQFGDLLACHPLNGIALVQCTAQSERQRHLDKMLAIPELAYWKEAGGKVFLHCWRKLKPRGKREKWEVREEIL